ncbi:MAG: 23S rRNA (pseudouridine(1915)-N(3))-methyltransferase RlmH [Rhizobiaceae bacterium]|nr:23S rRNA (pseudouridine(1915)-N(3))-methyltransferase RlmH [Rhizobiaceae bacterium]
MKISILATGRMKSGPDLALLERYIDRAQKSGKPMHLDGPKLREFTESRATKPELRKREESDQFLSLIAPDSYLLVLDEKGEDCPSIDFAHMIRDLRDEGTKHLAIAIGGPDGHGPKVLQRANKMINFGTMTWPHQLVRIMLAEQLYRTTTILSGHPYHRI